MHPLITDVTADGMMVCICIFLAHGDSGICEIDYKYIPIIGMQQVYIYTIDKVKQSPSPQQDYFWELGTELNCKFTGKNKTRQFIHLGTDPVNTQLIIDTS